MAQSKSKPYHKTISPVGWYVTNILLRMEWDDEDKNNLKRCCLAWENQILIKARTPEEAYRKAMEFGKESESEFWDDNDENRRGHWVFEGLTSLLAIYDKFEDGSEIVWKQYENRTVQKIQSWVSPKEELEVFSQK